MGNIGAQRMLLDVLGDADLDRRSRPGKRSPGDTLSVTPVRDHREDACAPVPSVPPVPAALREWRDLTPSPSRD